MNSQATSVEPFNKLVKLAARAFYDDVSTKGENQPKTGRSDNRGMAVVVLDALTRRQWVREDTFAKELKLHVKQLRRTLRFFEEEKLVTREHRRETPQGAKIFSAAVAAVTDGQRTGKGGEEKIKMHTHSYCCLDYAQIYDVLRYRIHRMRKRLKDELENRNTVQEYICPSCQRRYTAFDALQLISLDDESFRCESCHTELVAESDKLAVEEVGDSDENSRRKKREKVKDLLQKMEVQLKPLIDQLARVKDLPVPETGTLQAWERAKAGRASNGEFANDSSKSSQGQGYGGTAVPFLGETKVEVSLSGMPANEDDTKPDAGTVGAKLVPPWMVTKHMNLTKEQLGDIKQDLNIDSISAAVCISESDNKKLNVDQKDDEEIRLGEYAKAWYAAILKRQQQQQQQEAAQIKQLESVDTESIPNNVFQTSFDRRVGLKAKRGDVEVEEAPTGGSTGRMYDLNMPAEESEDDEEPDWQEG